MRTTLPTRTTEPDTTASRLSPTPRPPAGRPGRVAVDQRPEGGVVLRVRTKLPPAQGVGHVVLVALVVTFSLAAAGAVVIFSVAWVKNDFDFADTLANLPRFGAVPPHVVLAAAAVALLLIGGALAGFWMVLYGLLLPPVCLDVTRDGWLVRRGRGAAARELWRERAGQVESVDYGAASVIVRTADGRTRTIRGWDADMAWLAVALRWALESVASSAGTPTVNPVDA